MKNTKKQPWHEKQTNNSAYSEKHQANERIEQDVNSNFPIRIGFTPEGWLGIIIPELSSKMQKD